MMAGSLQSICTVRVCAETGLLWSGVIHVAVWSPLKGNIYFSLSSSVNYYTSLNTLRDLPELDHLSFIHLHWF